MSIAATTTYAPAAPGCCPRTCQDIIDIIQESLGVSIPNITSVIIGPNEPGVDERGNLWVKTGPVDSLGGATRILDILIWDSNSSTWVDFFFHVSSIEAGDNCTSLMTWNGSSAWRNADEQINCIPDGAIPCSKIDFGFVPEGCQSQKWTTTIKANQAAIDNGRIEFVVTWTSVTCGVGRRFVTQSPITLDANYDIVVCLPSDAAITSTVLYGDEINPFTNSTLSCTPPSCDVLNSIIPQTVQGGPFAVPSSNGTATQHIWAHGLPGRPTSVYVRFRYTGSGTPSVGYVVGDEVGLEMIQSADADNCFAYKYDATNVYVWGTKLGGGDVGPDVAKIADYDANGVGEGTWDKASWQLYITATYVASA